jgi:hypothetical protein
MLKLAGNILATPKVVPVFFDSDDQTVTAKVLTFASELGASSYWAATTSEYGVGPLMAEAPVHTGDVPAAHLDDSDIQAWLGAKLNGNDPTFPAADGNTIYLIPYPTGVSITQGGGTACVDFGAYHNSFKLDPAHGSVVVPYAVLPRCGGNGPLTGIDVITAGASHELIEAVTDPQPGDDPAYEIFDDDHAFWIYAVGGETGDSCAGSFAAYIKPAGLDFTVQRTWSNKASSALHDPCVPDGTGAFFNAAVVAPDTHSYETFVGTKVESHVINIPIGQTRDVEIDLFSDKATSGPWTVTLNDVNALHGLAPQLTFVLDKTSGVNGEKIQASVTAKKSSLSQPNGLSFFTVTSELGATQNTWVGGVRSQSQ